MKWSCLNFDEWEDWLCNEQEESKEKNDENNEQLVQKLNRKWNNVMKYLSPKHHIKDIRLVTGS